VKRLRSQIQGLLAFGLVAIGGGCFATDEGDAAAKRTDEAPCLSPEEAERLSDQVLQLVNLERAERDLSPVVVHPTLARMADDYACEMVNGKFFGHRHPVSGAGPADRAIAARYPFYAIGENLAAGSIEPAEVMRLWMESPSHRDIILDPTWKEIGIAVRAGGEHAVYWVQEFGDPAGY
jgi:uncharacterized protein YkwD